MKKVTASIIFNDNKILVARRGPQEKLAGSWEFPGGKVEENETLEECLERELYEELNIKTKSGKVLTSSTYTYKHGSFEIFALESEIISGTIQPTVHDKISWVNICDLLTYDLLPADIPIAKYLQENVNEF